MQIPVITGNICSGKSMCGDLLSELGYYIIDADNIVRKALLRGNYLYDSYIKILGEHILDHDRNIKKSAVSDIIFRDKDLKKKIEEIAHPFVLDEINDEYRRNISNNDKIICINPLYFEMKNPAGAGFIILIYCCNRVRMERLMKRNKVDQRMAEIMMSSQILQDRKVYLSDYIIDNSFDREFTKKQIYDLHGILKNDRI